MATANCHILLVDDHPDSVLFLARLLKLQGHTVRTADCCAGARELAASEAFDLVISDIGLPDGSGYKLMAELKTMHGLRGIALSGRADQEDLDASKQAGFEEHLVKPVALPAVIDAINRVRENVG